VKNTLIAATLAGLFGLAGTGFAAQALDENALKLQQEVFSHRLIQLAGEPDTLNRLEPCMNGEVSASGLFPTQAEEDAALAEAQRPRQAMSRQLSASVR
jgi:hypothetical protein